MCRPAISHERNSGPPLLFVLFALLGCAQEPLDPLPLDVTITAERTVAAAGDSIRFDITAQGGSLLGVIVEYGDEQSSIFNAFGARTARTSFRHAYAQAGVYNVEATVSDALAGDQTAGVRIEIR